MTGLWCSVYKGGETDWGAGARGCEAKKCPRAKVKNCGGGGGQNSLARVSPHIPMLRSNVPLGAY